MELAESKSNIKDSIVKRVCLIIAPFILYFSAIILHYLDFFIDIILCYEYFQLNNKLKFNVTLFFLILPNISICFLTIMYSLFNKKPITHESKRIQYILESSFFLLFTGCFNIQFFFG